MIFTKPFLIVFGGTSEENKCLNDLWILNIDDFDVEKFQWKQIKFKGKTPSPRTYLSGCVCKGGKAKGMIVIYGGRGENKTLYNELWGLRRHRDGSWEWVKLKLL